MRSVLPSTNTLTALSDVHLWVGLKGGNSQGVELDLSAELLQNGTVQATALERCIGGLTADPAGAKEAVLAWDPFSSLPLSPGDVLSLRVSSRIGTNPDGTMCGTGHQTSSGLRLYYDASARPSRFDMTI